MSLGYRPGTPYSSLQRTKTLFLHPHQEPTMTHTAPSAPFTASSSTTRSITLALALTVTMGVLGGMGQIARHEVRHAEALLASAQPVQMVVITGHRATAA
jgi:hypothetical protein